jgi:hypothetical protein
MSDYAWIPDLLKDMLQAGSAVAAAWAIVSGIDAWKREFIGKRKIELAQDTLAKFFEVKDAISYIRSPFSHQGEGSTRQCQPDESPQESEIYNRGYVAFERYVKRESTFKDFNVLKYKFMASFGSEHGPIFTETEKVVRSIINAGFTLGRTYWHSQRAPVGHDQYRRFQDQWFMFENIIWESDPGNDPINPKLQVIQKQLEDATKPCFDEMALYTSMVKKRTWKFWQWF